MTGSLLAVWANGRMTHYYITAAASYILHRDDEYPSRALGWFEGSIDMLPRVLPLRLPFVTTGPAWPLVWSDT